MSAVAALADMPAAVIFDMDGLLIDSERLSIRCWSEAAAELGFALPTDIWLRMVGFGERDSVRLLAEHLDQAQVAQLVARCYQLYEARMLIDMPLRPGVIELLELLREHQVPRAVATSTRQPRATQKLQAAGLLPYFQQVLSSSDVAQPKPAPDIYLLAAQRLGVSPSQCLVLEDSPTGVRAGLAAGMTVVQVPDLVVPDEAVRALGHRIVESLFDAQRLLQPLLPVQA